MLMMFVLGGLFLILVVLFLIDSSYNNGVYARNEMFAAACVERIAAHALYESASYSDGYPVCVEVFMHAGRFTTNLVVDLDKQADENMAACRKFICECVVHHHFHICACVISLGCLLACVLGKYMYYNQSEHYESIWNELMSRYPDCAALPEVVVLLVLEAATTGECYGGL